MHILTVLFFTSTPMRYLFVPNRYALQLCNSPSSLSSTVFEIRRLTQQFSSRWRYEWSHSVAHIQFTIPRHHVYKNSSHRSEIKRVTRDFSGHTVQRRRLIKSIRFFVVYVSHTVFIHASHNPIKDYLKVK